MASKEEDIAPLHLPLSEGPKSNPVRPSYQTALENKLGVWCRELVVFLFPWGVRKNQNRHLTFSFETQTGGLYLTQETIYAQLCYFLIRREIPTQWFVFLSGLFRNVTSFLFFVVCPRVMCPAR